MLPDPITIMDPHGMYVSQHWKPMIRICCSLLPLDCHCVAASEVMGTNAKKALSLQNINFPPFCNHGKSFSWQTGGFGCQICQQWWCGAFFFFFILVGRFREPTIPPFAVFNAKIITDTRSISKSNFTPRFFGWNVCHVPIFFPWLAHVGTNGWKLNTVTVGEFTIFDFTEADVCHCDQACLWCWYDLSRRSLELLLRDRLVW